MSLMYLHTYGRIILFRCVSFQVCALVAFVCIFFKCTPVSVIVTCYYYFKYICGGVWVSARSAVFIVLREYFLDAGRRRRRRRPFRLALWQYFKNDTQSVVCVCVHWQFQSKAEKMFFTSSSTRFFFKFLTEKIIKKKKKIKFQSQLYKRRRILFSIVLL